MLVFKFPIMIFIFTYFICHVHHKLSVTYVTTLDAIIFLSSVVIEKYYQPSPSIGSSSNVCISNLYKVFSEKILVTLTFLKKVDSLMSRRSRYSK